MAGRLFGWPSAMRQSVTFSQARHYASKSAIPVFSPTSSPELDQALTRFRQELFIPNGLPKRQRMSMFKERHARRLEEEPITVNIGESEEFTLRPMKLSQLPTKDDAAEVLRMMADAKEYRNLVPFMSGLWMSKYRVSPGRWEYLMRNTRPAGKLSLILECARQAERTGLRLRNVLLVQRLFFEFHRMAHDSGLKGPEVTKALNLAKQAVDIMDADLPDHAYDSPAKNPKTQLGVIATLLELSSARAVNDFGGKDNAKEVLSYAQKLIAGCPQGHFQNTAPTAETRRPIADKWVQEAALVYSGLQTSLSVHELAADKRLQNAVTTRLAEVKEALKTVLKNPSLKSLETFSWAWARDLLKA